jgi:hypothetical protein
MRHLTLDVRRSALFALHGRLAYMRGGYA